MVWEWNGVEMFSAILGPEMASEAISRASNFLWGGEGACPQIPLAGACLCTHSSTATGLIDPHSIFRPCQHIQMLQVCSSEGTFIGLGN